MCLLNVFLDEIYFQAAHKSIKFYENLDETEKDLKLLEFEVLKLKSSLGNSNENEESDRKISSRRVPTRIAIKAMAIGMVLVILNTCNGTVAITGYTATIFEDTGSNMTPNMSAIVIGLIQLSGSCLSMKIVDRFDRKVHKFLHFSMLFQTIVFLALTHNIYHGNCFRSDCIRCIHDA